MRSSSRRRPSISGARMGEPVGGSQLLGGDVRVDLSGAEARVAEELLHGAEVGPAVEQMRGGGVAQRVRSDGCLLYTSDAADE